MSTNGYTRDMDITLPAVFERSTPSQREAAEKLVRGKASAIARAERAVDALKSPMATGSCVVAGVLGAGAAGMLDGRIGQDSTGILSPGTIVGALVAVAGVAFRSPRIASLGAGAVQGRTYWLAERWGRGA